VILGPTASGKTKLAVDEALARNAEIISCDSMQVYKGLAIGTAQPEPELLAAVPHHFIACLDIHEPWDVNRFVTACREKMREIRSRGKEIVIAGGTGLYAKSLVYGHTLLPSDAKVFAEVVSLYGDGKGRRVLEAELEAVSPREEIPKDVLLNPRRLLRACEVVRITGKAPWQWHRAPLAASPEFEQRILLPDFAALKERIRLRTAQMLRDGWIEEAQRAIANGLLDTPTARQALGYREIGEYLTGRGAKTLAELQEILANRTIQYARRQITWFKHQHPGSMRR
jgi:tRNA dimethylallyltransferase